MIAKYVEDLMTPGKSPVFGICISAVFTGMFFLLFLILMPHEGKATEV
jgi:hypothetical protein